MSQITINKSSRKTFWTVAAFYGLITFEFFYMASPFAVYFYSIYRPGLNLISSIPGMSWLLGFFLPHIAAETSSPFINIHNKAGAVIAAFGLLIFCVSAGQVYYAKLRKKGAVTGGIYKYIRHPQYAAFAVCSFGLLLLWPRYLVLIMFITIMFAYYFLAKLEERECEAKFGEKYLAYKETTNMFIPFRISLKSRIGFRSQSKIRAAIFYVFLYIMAMMLSLSIAYGLQKWSLDSLYTYAGKNSLYLAVHKMKTSDLQILAKIAVTDERAAIKIDSVEKSFDAQFLNYVLPANWFISEIPMNNGGHGGNHFLGQQANENDHLYKIIFTRAVLSDNKIFSSKNLLSATVFTVPLVEVWIDLVDKKVIKILEPPQEINYENIPLPVY